MNIIDIAIIVLIVTAVIRGKDIGLVRQLFSAGGFIGGLFLGAYLQRYTIEWVDSPADRSLVTIITTLGTALICLSIGEYIGIALKRKFEYLTIDKFDKWLGSGISIVTLLATVWLGASLLSSLPFHEMRATLKDSSIVSSLNRSLPPAPTIIASLGRLISPNGFPQVFTGGEPEPAHTQVPGISAELQAAIHKAEDSVVRIEGLGCGGVVEGSGFIVGHDTIITNAHVVAGIAKPYVIDEHGQHTATAIWFDPALDFAVLRVPNLAGAPLTLQYAIAKSGTVGAILGYPGGGPLTAGGAQVLNHFMAAGRDIYGEDITRRQVYELAGRIKPGNSGGPIIASDGTVIGIIFAESTTYNNVGYALSLPQIEAALSQAQAQNRTISTGSCAG